MKTKKQRNLEYFRVGEQNYKNGYDKGFCDGQNDMLDKCLDEVKMSLDYFKQPKNAISKAIVYYFEGFKERLEKLRGKK